MYNHNVVIIAYSVYIQLTAIKVHVHTPTKASFQSMTNKRGFYFGLLFKDFKAPWFSVYYFFFIEK